MRTIKINIHVSVWDVANKLGPNGTSFPYKSKVKIGIKTFLVCVWLEGEEGKKLVEPRCFLSRPTKMYSLQNGEKTEWE